MLVLFKSSGKIVVTNINDDDDFEQLLADGLLPFTASDEYRQSVGEMPEWPVEYWADTFLETGAIPDLGPYEQVPTRADVNSERDRRIAFGRVVTLTSGKVVPIQGRSQDQTNMLGLVTRAQLRKLSGDTTPTTFRDRDNTDHALTPDEIIELWTRGVAYFELVMQAAWALKDLDPIPTDFADDVHWPNAS